MSAFRGVIVLEADICRSVIDPLDVYIFASFTKVVVCKCLDVVGVHIIDAADVDFVPLRFESGIFGVDGRYYGGGVGLRCA